MLRLIGTLSLTLIASPAFGQVIYEPVVTQYGGQSPYYYAGHNPQVHEAARFPSAPGAVWGRIPGYAFVSPRRQVVERNVRVFTDAFGTVDARPWGLTPNQVVNEANARLPRYFTKRDLLAAAQTVATPTGPTFTVPADATAPGGTIPRGTMTIRPTAPGLHSRYPTFAFPRQMMERKIADVINGQKRV